MGKVLVAVKVLGAVVLVALVSWFSPFLGWITVNNLMDDDDDE